MDFITGLAAEVAAFETTYNITADDPLPASYVEAWQRSTTTPATPEWFLDIVIAETLKVPVKCWQAGMQVLLSGNVTTEISGIAAPVLSIRGVDDFIPLSQSVTQAENIPNFLFNKVTGAGHSPHWEKAGYIADVIDAYLEAWPLPSSV
jgi:pimeloyl-ACP methyl ester carboxylesterase